VGKLTDSVQQMRQPIRAIETFLSLVDVSLLQFDQSAANIGTSFSISGVVACVWLLYFCTSFDIAFFVYSFAVTLLIICCVSF